MDTLTFRKIRSQLKDEGLLGIDNLKGVATVVVESIVFASLVYGIALTAKGSLVYFGLEILAGVSLFRWFVILHECGHNTLYSSVKANSLVGHMASLFCLVPYFSWRNIHLLHHRWVGVIDKDPTQRDLLNLRKPNPVRDTLFRWSWKLWLPFPFIKFIIEVFWGYGWACSRAGDWRNAKLGWFSNVVCVAAHAGVIAAIGIGQWAVIYLPMLAVFYFMIENMNLPQHSELFPYLSQSHPRPVPFSSQDTITRSTHMPYFVSVALALNFNRHTEHHLFPSAPWYALNGVRRHLLANGYRYPHEVPFITFMWHLRKRDPLTVYRDALPAVEGGDPA